MSELLTKAERIRRAMDRAEQAMADLLSIAERWASERSPHDRKCDRRDLLGVARRYSRSMDALTRIRK